jgi:hypothetical protein
MTSRGGTGDGRCPVAVASYRRAMTPSIPAPSRPGDHAERYTPAPSAEPAVIDLALLERVMVALDRL